MPSKSSPARPTAPSTRPRRRRPSTPTPDTAVESTPAPAPAPALAAQPEAQEPPRKRRSRGGRAKAAVQVEEAAETALTVPEPEPVVADPALADHADEVELAPAAPSRPSRRGTAKPRRRDAVTTTAAEARAAAPEPVVEPEPEPEPEAEPAPARRSRPPRARGSSRQPRQTPPRAPAESPAPAPAQTPAHARAHPHAHARTGRSPAPTAAAGPQAEITPPADGLVFGRYAVQVPAEEPAEVTLRTLHAGTAWCSCLDFLLSEEGDCPHVQALNQYLQTDAERAAALARGPQAVGSRVALLHGARRRLLWLPGTECPSTLTELADQLLGVPPDALDDQALPRLLRAAREAGHDLQVEEAVWAHLAAARDARWRVHRLQALLPQGPASPALVDLRPQPLLPLQLEAALFAVCAGRCILADTAELQPRQQALAATRLWRQHFGIERVLVLAPAETLDRWRRELPEGEAAAGWSLTALDSVASDGELHQSLAPQLVIVDEPVEGGLWVDAERAAALLRLASAHAIVLPASGWMERPAELPLRLAFVDAQRLGAYAALLDEHGERDTSGQLCGLHDLDDLRDTLAPVLLARPLDEVRSELPERIDRLLSVAMPADAQALHSALAAPLASAVARWLALGWLPDSEQRRLLAAVQALRQLCAGVDAPGISAAKAEAVRAVLTDTARPAPKLVVFSQWLAALQALQPQLAAAGIQSATWCAQDTAAERQAAVQRFESDRHHRVLLVADAGSAMLELRCPAAQLLHLDRPFNPRQLTRRFGRVHRRGKAHLVPVTHLLLAGSFEQGLQRVLGERDEPVPDLLDANAAEGFLQGEALQQWLADLAAVLGASSADG